MFLNRYVHSIVTVITCMILNTCIIGCKKNSGDNNESSQSNHHNISAFALDYDNSDQLQILTSELFLRNVIIRQHHIGQNQPTLYNAKDISKIVLHNAMYPDTKEWIVVRIDFYLKDGSVRSEQAFKAWGVELNIVNGKGSRPVSIEQHFSRKGSLLEQEPKNEVKGS